jgi:phosphotriesterase-related protein
MDPRAEMFLGQLLTVRGPVPAEDMGITLPHEHIIIRHQGPLVDSVDPTATIEELSHFAKLGGRTVVDMTNVGLQRDAATLRQVSERAGVHIVMGTGYYKDGWLPAEAHQLSVKEMTSFMLAEILDGVAVEDGGGPVRAGVIGEVGVSRPTTMTEERSLASAARAHRQTGVAINVHFDIGGASAELNHAVDILEGEGADLNRVVLDHFICRPDEVELCQQLVGHGCYIEFDLWGQEKWPKIAELTRFTPPEVQVASLRWFISAGLLDRILISQDVANLVTLSRHGGYGRTHILKNLWPMFNHYGITDEHLKTIMMDNPRRLFPIQPVTCGRAS